MSAFPVLSRASSSMSCGSSHCGQSSETPQTSKISAQREKITPPNDAEDLLHRKKPRIQRQVSTPNLHAQNFIDRKEECRKKSGHLWKCVESLPNPLGGRILRYRLRHKYDSVTPKNWTLKTGCRQNAQDRIDEIHPAVEIKGEFFLPWDPNIHKKKESWTDSMMSAQYSTQEEAHSYLASLSLYRKKSYLVALTTIPDHVALMQRLGFKSDLVERQTKANESGMYLEIPDRDALEVNWRALRAKDPNTPALDIILSNGIANDIAFAFGFLAHDGLYSDGIEAFHDAFLHLFPIIRLAKQAGVKKPDEDTPGESRSDNLDKSYGRIKFLYVKLILTGYRKVMLLEEELTNPTLDIEPTLCSALEHNMKMFKAVLGALTDIISNGVRMEEYASLIYPDQVCFFNEKLQRLWKFPSWQRYWARRFSGEVINFEQLFLLWHQIEIIEKKLDSRRLIKILEGALANNSLTEKDADSLVDKTYKHLYRPLHKETNVSQTWLLEKKIITLVKKLAENASQAEVVLNDLSLLERELMERNLIEVDSALDLPLHLEPPIDCVIKPMSEETLS